MAGKLRHSVTAAAATTTADITTTFPHIRV
jgi:hypothetical protein